MRTLRAIAEQIPPDHSGSVELETRELSAAGQTYEQAKIALEAQVPDGWRLISLKWRYDQQDLPA